MIPDEDIIDMILNRVQGLNGVILDGFPRTVAQAEKLEQALKIDAVINLEAKLEVIMDRICSRRVCKDCKTVYNVKTHPETSCDSCGGEHYHKSGRQRKTVSSRYGVYLEQTQPLIDFYKKRGVLHTVNGEGDIKQVEKEILDLLK